MQTRGSNKNKPFIEGITEVKKAEKNRIPEISKDWERSGSTVCGTGRVDEGEGRHLGNYTGVGEQNVIMRHEEVT